MDEYVISIFMIALVCVALTLGAWFVRGVSRAEVRTAFGTWTRAENAAGYWFWAIYHVAGMASLAVAIVAAALHFALGFLK
ncbi:MAG: hypothetical protein WDM89_20175 [Rhizomicrobium sp.]